jgi:tetratricopeptide (TPR) repeat protein
MMPAMDARTADSLLQFAEASASMVKGEDGRETLDALEARYADLLAALEWFLGGGQVDEALRLANALYPFWITKQGFADGQVWFGRALASGLGEVRLRGSALVNAAFMPFWAGDDDRAAREFRAALELGRQLNDAGLVSRALGGLVRVALRTDVAEARRLAHEALAVAEAAGDELARSNAIHLLGVGAQIAGDLHEARDWMTERLTIVRAQQNQFLIGSEAANLSMVERQLGNLDGADALAREALRIAEARGDEFLKPFAMSGLASIAFERAEHVRAATLVGAAETIMERHSMAWPPDERPHYERLLSVLPAAMGASAFDAARAAGAALTTDDAVALALGPRGAAPA